MKLEGIDEALDAAISLLEKQLNELRAAKADLCGNPPEPNTAHFRFQAVLRELRAFLRSAKEGS